MKEELKIVRYALRLAAVATFGIGLSLLLVSKVIVSLFSGNDVSNEHFAVYLGTALIGFAVGNWLFSKLPDASSMLPAVYGNIASLLPATLIDAVSVFSSRDHKIIWLVLLMHIGFLALFAYCLRAIMVLKPNSNFAAQPLQ